MTTETIITGTDAIDYAAAHGIAVQKYADPTEGAREVTVEEARAIAREDPSLLWVQAPSATALDATYAAIGTDGMREVVWGLGSTEAAAEADAREQEDPPEDLRTLPITAAAADAVRAGTVGLDGRGGLTVSDGVIEVADGRRAEGAL